MFSLSSVRIGNPVCYEALTVFPLFESVGSGLDYLLSERAISQGAVTVEELSEGGSVPTLVVDNHSDCHVLFLEGEELRGAKQNRVLNTSVLVAAQSKTTIPVSCVEQGRWRYNSRHFGATGHHASPKLRHVLKKSVSQSATEGLGHGSDQGGVWAEVSRQMRSHGANSPTVAMFDTYESYQPQLAEFQNRLKYVEGATGLAVGIRKKIVSIDLFDKPSTCQEVWARLMTGAIMDALEAGSTDERAESIDVQQMLDLFRDSSWQKTTPVGIGDEYRCDAKDERHASVLSYNDRVVHGSMVAVT